MTTDASPKSRLPNLSTRHHDRDVVGYKYVYPVVSRRSHGVSIGINLCPNNACNWRCVYCQVDGLVRGAPPPIDLALLAQELDGLFEAIERDSFLERHVALEYRQLTDLALSGNGEPTSSAQFGEVIELLADIRQSRALVRDLPVVLITNGSLADRASVQAALARLGQIGGRVWFKLDAGTDEGLRRTNSCSTRLARHLGRLRIVAGLCPTQIQSCWFQRANQSPDPGEVACYLAELRTLYQEGVPIGSVQLYTLARESRQLEAPLLSPVTPEWLAGLAASIEQIGLSVQIAY